MALLVFLYLSAFQEFVLFGTRAGDMVLNMMTWPADISRFVVERVACRIGEGCDGYECEPPENPAIIIAVLLYPLYFTSLTLAVSWAGRKASKKLGVSPIKLSAALAMLLAFALASGLFMDRKFDHNPNLPEMLFDKLKPGMKLSEVRKHIPRKMYCNHFGLQKTNIDALKNNATLDDVNKIYISDCQKIPVYRLYLRANGTQNVYNSSLFFTYDKRLVGILYHRTHTKPSISLEPLPIQDYSETWRPKWESVYKPFTNKTESVLVLEINEKPIKKNN